MAIRLPLKVIETFTDTNELGAGSVSGGVAHLLTIPQDTDNVVVKMSASVKGTGISATFQTTDDGGTTWYDVARTSIVSDTKSGYEEWLTIPVQGHGFRSQVIGQNSVAGATNEAIALNTIGNAPAASTLGSAQQSGLPLLSPTARIFIRINGDVTSAAANLITTKVMVNSQSATA